MTCANSIPKILPQKIMAEDFGHLVQEQWPVCRILKGLPFSLQKPGEFSDPFQTQYGWHIIRLGKEIPLPSFEVLAPSLKNRVLRDERTEISKQALQAKLRTENQFQENKPSKVRGNGAGRFQPLTGNMGSRLLFRMPTKQILFSLKDQAYTVKHFLNTSRKTSAKTRTACKIPGPALQQLCRREHP